MVLKVNGLKIELHRYWTVLKLNCLERWAKLDDDWDHEVHICSTSARDLVVKRSRVRQKSTMDVLYDRRFNHYKTSSIWIKFKKLKKKGNVTNVSTSHNRITSVTQLIYILVYQTIEWKIISPNHYQIKSQWSAVYIQIICSIEKPVQDPVWSGSVDLEFIFFDRVWSSIFELRAFDRLSTTIYRKKSPSIMDRLISRYFHFERHQSFGPFSAPWWTVNLSSTCTRSICIVFRFLLWSRKA